jgi:hypothetical protein
MVHPPWVWGEKRQMSHDGIEWERNLQGLLVFLKWRPALSKGHTCAERWSVKPVRSGVVQRLQR